MAHLAFAVAFLALGGALASWVVGAWHYARTLRTFGREHEPHGAKWLTVLVWPFAIGRIKGAAGAHAANVNKAVVCVFACLTVAAAAASVATNLARMSG